MNTTTNSTVDPFMLEVFKSAYDSIADEMALIIMRTSYSPIVRDSMDYSTAICDHRGRTLAQGLTTPMHLGSFYDAMQCLLERYSGRINQGDVFIFNDPYDSAGQHLPDIYIISPIFHETEIVAWATTIAHHSDVGGIVAGSNALNATEIIQEGIRIPIVKFIEAGKPVQPIWDIVALNVRLPREVMGDLQAQVAACAAAERGIRDLIQRYGETVVKQYYEYLHDYAERVIRSVISDIPDGTYTFENHIDGLGENPVPVELKVSLTVSGSDILVDWNGSSPAVPFGINSSFPFTKAAAYAAIRSVMPPDLPNCHGFNRAIKVSAPVGCIMNPVYPSPCGARGMLGFRMIDCLFGALSKAVPDKVAADSNGGATIPTISGWKDGEAYVFCETFMGTWGAAPTHDGAEGVPHIGANQSNVPIELIEANYPIRIERYGLTMDTGGAGKYRGGLAIHREYRFLDSKGVLNIRSDKRDHPPYGLFGGEPGSPSMNKLTSDGRSRTLPVLLSNPVPLKKDDIYLHTLAGGGGRGNPFERDPELVLEDVLDEKVSIEAARKTYGVVIDLDLGAVDQSATEQLRASHGQMSA